MVSLPPFCVRTHFTYSSMVLAGVPPETASTLAKVAKPATGTKSVAGLKPGFLMTCGRIEMVWSCDSSSVWPSAGAAFRAVGGDLAARARAVLDHHRHAQLVLELFAQRARDGVGARAGRKADQQPDGRAALRLRKADSPRPLQRGRRQRPANRLNTLR
jgi:hypothetical protein